MRSAILLVISSVYLFGQTPPIPKIEVSSVKPAAWPSDDLFEKVRKIQNGCLRTVPQISGYRLTWNLASLCTLVRSAYDIDQLEQIVGAPKWFDTPDAKVFFDIQMLAKVPDGTAVTRDQARTLLRELLADRFHLTIHSDERELPVYELKIAKGGPKVLSTDLHCCERNRPGRFLQSCTPTYTMDEVARLLSGHVGRTVVNRTAYTSKFAFLLVWSDLDADPAADAPPGLFTALTDQLGLKLESSKTQVPVLVIDSVAMPTGN
jgi:uncharacterized protein (TIGR03435 family)